MTPHRVLHDILHSFTVFGSIVAAIGGMNAEKFYTMLGGSLAVGSMLASWYFSIKAKKQDEDRRADWLDFEIRLKKAIAQKEAGVEIESAKPEPSKP